jgi:pyruvate dehydrogenase E1 component alpha subunit
VAEARKGEGPSMIENKTYRIRGHFEGDPQKYREQAEVLTWQEKNDPIKRFEERLIKEEVLTKKKSKKVWDEAKAELDAALEFAKNSPFPEPEDALQDLFVNA